MIVDPLAEERPAIYQRNLCIADKTCLSSIHSFCRCCLSNLRNHAKFRENSNLRYGERILKIGQYFRGRKPCCRKETARCCSSSFRFKVRRQHSLQVIRVAKLRKPGFRAPKIPAQNRILTQTQGYSRSRVLQSVKGDKGLSRLILNTNVGLILDET